MGKKNWKENKIHPILFTYKENGNLFSGSVFSVCFQVVIKLVWVFLLLYNSCKVFKKVRKFYAYS